MSVCRVQRKRRGSFGVKRGQDVEVSGVGAWVFAHAWGGRTRGYYGRISKGTREKKRIEKRRSCESEGGSE